MEHRQLLLSLCVLCLVTIPLLSSAQDGRDLFAPCVACHGADARGNSALGAPALAGQDADYLARQLMLFRNGQRGAVEGDSFGAQMAPFAAMLADDAAVATVVAWVSALPPNPSVAVGQGDARRGASLYNGNCGACHGGQAQGNPALKAPRLAGLDPAYLTRQLTHYRNGLRGTDPGDRPGRQMAMMAGTLTDKQSIADVLAYVASLAGVETVAP